MNDQIKPRPCIISLWVSDKAAVILEDATHLEPPKLRLAIIPAKKKGAMVDFYLDIPTARVLFGSLESGQLTGPAVRRNKSGQKDKGFDSFTRTDAMTRTLNIQDKPDGIGVHLVNIGRGENGNRRKNSVYLGAFQVQIFAQAAGAYIHALDPHDLTTIFGSGDDDAGDLQEQEPPVPETPALFWPKQLTDVLVDNHLAQDEYHARKMLDLSPFDESARTEVVIRWAKVFREYVDQGKGIDLAANLAQKAYKNWLDKHGE
jgi:hypothetical protein